MGTIAYWLAGYFGYLMVAMGSAGNGGSHEDLVWYCY